MDHARIVTVDDLRRFTGMTSSREVLPELVKQLIYASCSVCECRIPGIDDTNQHGLDGLVVTEGGCAPFVPDRESWWETSNEKAVQKKADRVIADRASMSAEEKGRAIFVFATFRPWSEISQRKWKKKHVGLGFRGIEIVDATQFADWLMQRPAVARWLLVTMGEVGKVSALRCVNEHWQELQSGRLLSDPEIPPQFFLRGRTAAADAVTELFLGKRRFVWLGVENGRDAQDFVAAVVASQAGETRRSWSARCLFVDGVDEWAAMTRLRTPHVLVAGEQLDLEEREDLRRQATQAGHAIVVPMRSGGSGESIVQLLPPTARHVEDALVQGGWPRPRVEQLLGDGFSSLSVLKRRMAGEPDYPAYAVWDFRRELGLAGLLGGWQEAYDQDVGVVAEVIGMRFDEWRGRVAPLIPRPGAPLILRDRSWRMHARGEAWHALGSALVDDDLLRFEKAACQVLGETDPTIDLPKEERWMASVHGKKRAFSELLRRGMAETLALLGCRAKALSAASQGCAEQVASRVVSTLLHGADWPRWMSVHDLLPMLAEASPGGFLSALEAALSKPPESPFAKLFEQEGSGFMGHNYVTGLLWALETLAWHPSYFGRSIAALVALASIDPGGQSGNRPANSLAKIFLPWFPQTTAPLKARLAAIRAAAKKHGPVAWGLITKLLPEFGGASSGARKPAWRADLMADWREDVSHAFYCEQVGAYLGIAVEMAAENPTRLAELLDRLPEMAVEQREVLLGQLLPALQDKPEVTVLPVWEALRALAAKHRSFSEAAWVMPEEAIAKVEAAAAAIQPKDTALRHRRLFGGLSPLEDGELDFEELERRTADRRRKALEEILAGQGFDRVLAMIAEVKESRFLGESLGRLDRRVDDGKILPRMLEQGTDSERAFAAAFVRARWQQAQWAWVEALPMSAWTPHQKALLLACLPFTSEVWQRAESILANDSAEYWRVVSPWPWGKDELEQAAELFLQHGRPLAALAFCGAAARQDKPMCYEVAMRTLEACLRASESTDRFDPSMAQAIFAWLQKQDGVDQMALSMLEWGYLGVLDRFHGPGPKALEARIASDPALFCEALRLVYYSEDELADDALGAPKPEDDRRAGEAAARLLRGMVAIPGMSQDGTFDGSEFKAWLHEVRRIAAGTGHLAAAFIQVGQLIGRAATSSDWMVKMPALAEELDAEDAGRMRLNFRCQLVNNRGVFSPSSGREEAALAKNYSSQADQAELHGWLQVATTLRGLAESYERDAEQARRRSEDE